MPKDTLVSYRLDRELRKRIIKQGDYNVVPYEDALCRIKISEVDYQDETGPSDKLEEARMLIPAFDGNVRIGDSDGYMGKDVELILQQMCAGEVCWVTMTYRNGLGLGKKQFTFKLKLKSVIQEDLVSDWDYLRLYEQALHNKDRGVELIQLKRLMDAFRRFNKALKLMIAIDQSQVEEDMEAEVLDLKIKIYNNLAYCQLQCDEFDAALVLANKALTFDPNHIKSLYRRCSAYTGLDMYEEAWNDIQKVLSLEPNNKEAQKKAAELKPKVQAINKEYANVMKKMFV